MKRFNNKGFTLAELLIVVAIIAVLAAISIPIFTAQLHKARIAADEANIRNGYAAASAQVLTDAGKTDAATTYYLKKDGTVVTADPGTDAFTTSDALATTDTKVNIAGQEFTTWGKGKSVSYEVSATKVTIKIAN